MWSFRFVLVIKCGHGCPHFHGGGDAPQAHRRDGGPGYPPCTQSSDQRPSRDEHPV